MKKSSEISNMGDWEVGGTIAPNEYGCIQFIYNGEEQTDMDRPL